MLAEGTRIQLLWALVDGELSVNELAETIGKPGPSVSQHLAKLRMARLVRTRRDGTQIFYQLENDHVRQLIIDGIHNAEHAGPAVPAHHATSITGSSITGSSITGSAVTGSVTGSAVTALDSGSNRRAAGDRR